MKAICLNCFNALEFANKRGNKLSDHTCDCGGKFTRPVVHLDNEYSRFYTAKGKDYRLSTDLRYFYEEKDKANQEALEKYLNHGFYDLK